MPYIDPEARRANNRLRCARYRERNPEKVRASEAKYKERNREEIRARNREWMLNNRPRIRESQRAWKERNYEQIRAKAQEKYRKRAAYINAYKLAKGCVDCGYNAHPAALEFDHRDPSLKIFAVSSRMNNKWESVLREIEKCDVRCANCHRIRTVGNRHCVR